MQHLLTAYFCVMIKTLKKKFKKLYLSLSVKIPV